MGFLASGEAPFNLPAGSLCYSGSQLTPASVNTTGIIQSVALSNAAVSYDRLLVMVSGTVTGQAIQQFTIRAHNGTGAVGAAKQIINQNGGVEQKWSWSYLTVLVAGVDYVKATGFTLSSYATVTSGTYAGDKIQSCSLVVLGMV